VDGRELGWEEIMTMQCAYLDQLRPASPSWTSARTAQELREIRDRRTVVSSTTQSTIRWQTSLEEALRQAHADDKLVLLDFFSPT
jgi:uncharacterized protein (DUF4415 family)